MERIPAIHVVESIFPPLYLFKKKAAEKTAAKFFALSPHSSFLFTISGKILSAYSKRALATAISSLYWLTLTAFSLTFS